MFISKLRKGKSHKKGETILPSLLFYEEYEISQKDTEPFSADAGRNDDQGNGHKMIGNELQIFFDGFHQLSLIRVRRDMPLYKRRKT